MNLLEKTSILRQRVKGLDEGKARIAELNALQVRSDEADRARSELSVATTFANLLRQQEIKLPLPPPAAKEAKISLLIIRERFLTDSKAATLTKGQDWPTLIRLSKEAAVAVSKQVEVTWKSYVESLYTGDTPNDIDSSLAKTDQNAAVLNKYRLAFEQFRQLAQSLPNNADEIRKAQAIADRLKAISREFDLNVPKSVKRFLDAVSQTGAGLDLATEEVTEWLKENGTFDRYKIIAGRK